MSGQVETDLDQFWKDWSIWKAKHECFSLKSTLVCKLGLSYWLLYFDVFCDQSLSQLPQNRVVMGDYGNGNILQNKCFWWIKSNQLAMLSQEYRNYVM